ncbi:hypothetical protein D3C76_48050 [compost metagenome]
MIAFNAADINGSNEIWSWYGSADIELLAAGGLLIGAPLSGSAAVEVSAAGEAFARLRPAGSPADIRVSAGGSALYGRSASADAVLRLASQADGRRWALGQGDASIKLKANGDAQVVSTIAASFSIVVDSTLFERTTPAIKGKGVTTIELHASMVDGAGRASMASGKSTIEVASTASPSLRVAAPAAVAEVKIEASGDARLGGKVYLEAREARIELYARGDIGTCHYVYGEGEAKIAVQAGMLQAGNPAIPNNYVPAPASRTFIVQPDQRDMVVARQNRSI